LHSDVEDLDPEDYPDIHKMAILADVAPYSREYHTFQQMVGKQAQGQYRTRDRVREDPETGQADQVSP